MNRRNWKGPRLRGALAVAALFVVVTAMGFAAAQPQYSLAQIGTYWGSVQRFDSLKNGQAGCYAEIYVAGDSEWVGNIAYIGSTTINKLFTDTILTNYNNVAGVIVGGQRTAMKGYADSTSVGTLAATAGQKVLLCAEGRVWVTHDTTATTLPGSVIIPSNRQGQRGRFTSKTTAIDSFYRSIGKALDTGLSGRRTLIRLRVK